MQLSSEDMTLIWRQAAGGVNKDRVKLEVQPLSSCPTALLSGASASPEEIETMQT